MRTILFLISGLLLYGCNSINPIQSMFSREPHPYKKYVKGLADAKLDETVLARKWIQAGERAMADSVIVSLPFSESGYFDQSLPDARSYRFTAREGQVLTVKATVYSREKAEVFLDLFATEEGTWNQLTHADSTLTLKYEFEEDKACLLRAQPELLVNVYYTLSISITPVLINPVAGATNKSIGSFYGDSRDGGKRAHEGVDIFAKKGTPVVAPVNGVVTRVGTSSLGGKVVWLRDHSRGHAYYFAHLDEQLVSVGAKLRQGDTLGTVGNTGNARQTPPHLHFGIYQRGSKDPINYIRTIEALAEALPWDTTFTQPAFRVVAREANFRGGPGEKELALTTLKRDSYVRVVGQSNEWFRVILPNYLQGFIHKSVVEPIDSGKKLKIKSAMLLLAEAHESAPPILSLAKGSGIQVLAEFETFKYVRTKDGQFGWLSI